MLLTSESEPLPWSLLQIGFQFQRGDNQRLCDQCGGRAVTVGQDHRRDIRLEIKQ